MSFSHPDHQPRFPFFDDEIDAQLNLWAVPWPDPDDDDHGEDGEEGKDTEIGCVCCERCDRCWGEGRCGRGGLGWPHGGGLCDE